MQIVTTRTGHSASTGKKCVMVQHDGKEAVFITVKLNVPEIRPNDYKLMGTTEKHKKDFNLIVAMINGYFASLPMATQDAIFDIYKEIETALEVTDATQELHEHMKSLVQDLYKLITYKDIEEYVLVGGRKDNLEIQLPELKTKYDIDSPDNDRTYLLDDYVDLMCFSIALKPMLPIWGQYIETIAAEVGTIYKEDRAASLIDDTHLLNTKAYKRFSRYVHAYTTHSSGDIGLAAVLGNMSSIGFPKYLLNLSMVRKLATSKLPLVGSPLEAGSLIRECYSYIKSKVERPESVFRGLGYIRDKVPEYSDKEDDNSSNLERFKMRERLDKGTIMGIKAMIDSPYDLLNRFDYTAPHEYLEASLAWIHARPSVVSSPALVFLIQHVLSGFQIHRPLPAIKATILEALPNTISYPNTELIKTITFSSSMVHLMDLPRLLNLAAITQALLAHNGYYNLAALITSRSETTPGARLMGSNFDPIEGPLVDKAIGLYSFLHLSTNERSTMLDLKREAMRGSVDAAKYNTKLIAKNPLVNTTHKTVQSWNKHSWTPEHPEYLEGKVFFRTQRNEGQNKVLPPGIKNELFKMVLKTKSITEW